MPYLLPDVIDPDRISVCVPVPDDDAHRRAFLGALYSLTYSRNWERDQDHSAALVARVWTDIYEIVSERLDLGELCGGDTVDCCDDVLRKLAAIDATQRALQNILRGQNYDGTPTSINPSSPTTNFDDAGGTEYSVRNAALCIAVRQYVYGAMQAQIDAAGQAIGLAAPGAFTALFLGGPVAWVVGAVIVSATAFLYQDLIDAAADQDALDNVVCSMYHSLKGLPVTEANFSAAIDAIPFTGGHADTIAGVVKGARSRQESWFYMVDLLGAAKDAVDLGAEGDCCGLECGLDVDFRITSGGANIARGVRNLARGVDATTPTVGGWWSTIIFEFDQPCSDNQAKYLWRNIGVGGSRNAYWKIRRASDQVWSPNSGQIPSDATTWWPLNMTYAPFDAIRFDLETYGTGPVLATTEAVGTRQV